MHVHNIHIHVKYENILLVAQKLDLHYSFKNFDVEHFITTKQLNKLTTIKQ